MTRSWPRKIVLTVAAGALFSSCQASAAEGLTVHCKIVAKWPGRKTIKFEQFYFLDSDTGKFCDTRCAAILNVETATDKAVTFHMLSSDLDDFIIPNWEERVTIDRKSGALTGTSRSAGSAVSRSVLTGRCTFIRSLPAPVAIALRAAPMADRATLVGPAPQ